MDPTPRTAVIMPICNEDVATVFAGLRATCESLAATGHGARQFDVFVLSDTGDPRWPPPSAPPGKTCAQHWRRPGARRH
jgi:membrane glycosyltransferase